jgi:hypothetical protein
VEKELLHHDILREMSEAGLLTGLTFIGGTCLRACYGSARLSEDLDFTGGSRFKKSDLAELARVLTERLQTRYGLPVSVSEPVKTGGKVSTWKLTIETRPGQRHLPAQRIHLDICAIPSHDPRPMMLRNLYGIDLGTSGLILQARAARRSWLIRSSRSPFARTASRTATCGTSAGSPSRALSFPFSSSLSKSVIISTHAEFATLLSERTNRCKRSPLMRDDFMKEMRRFLPATAIRDTVEKEPWWSYLTQVIDEQAAKALKAIS